MRGFFPCPGSSRRPQTQALQKSSFENTEVNDATYPFTKTQRTLKGDILLFFVIMLMLMIVDSILLPTEYIQMTLTIGF